MQRRRYLTAVGTAAIALAGCSGGDDGQGSQLPQGEGDGGGDGSPGSPTTTAPLPDHAALEGVDAQPHLGPAPGQAPATIVAFEDPSCPRCRRFEQNTVPKIRERLTRRSRATLVVRGYPVIYPWGEPATRALESVFDRTSVAFWQLWAHYYDQQSAFRDAGPDAVYDRTETFLAEQTQVNAAAAVTAAREGEYDAAVQADLDAGQAAGAGGTTPHLFFFRGGEYLTKVSGSVSYSLVESALGY